MAPTPDIGFARLFNLRHPFFNPPWRRVAMTIFVGVWAIVEFATAEPLWGVLFGAVAVWCAWTFFFSWDGPVEDPDKN